MTATGVAAGRVLSRRLDPRVVRAGRVAQPRREAVCGPGAHSPGRADGAVGAGVAADNTLDGVAGGVLIGICVRADEPTMFGWGDDLRTGHEMLAVTNVRHLIQIRSGTARRNNGPELAGFLAATGTAFHVWSPGGRTVFVHHFAHRFLESSQPTPLPGGGSIDQRGGDSSKQSSDNPRESVEEVLEEKQAGIYGNGSIRSTGSSSLAHAQAARNSSWCSPAHSLTRVNALGGSRPAKIASVSILIRSSWPACSAWRWGGA